MGYSRILAALPPETPEALRELLEQLNRVQEESDRRFIALEKRIKELEVSDHGG